MSTRVECIIPILCVRDLRASLDFYLNTLGFQRDWPDDEAALMVGLSRDGCPLYLCQGDQGQPGTWVWIGVEDLDPIYERLQRAGAVIRREPENFPWAYELQVEDPDGHVLRIGSEPR